jgi:eukaryotic-like serine/threonine-protein kinase
LAVDRLAAAASRQWLGNPGGGSVASFAGIANRVRGRWSMPRAGGSAHARARRAPALLAGLGSIAVLVAVLLPGAAVAAPFAAPAQPQTASGTAARPQSVSLSGDWTQYRNGPTHEGYNAQEHVLSTANVDALSVAWSVAIGGAVWSSAAVANGVVYVGSADGRLYAYKVGCSTGGGTCSPIWKSAATAGIYSSPAVVGGVVYVGSLNGKLYAFSVGCGTGGATCSPLWSADAGGPVFSPPTVDGGMVYVGGNDGRIRAFAVGCGTGGATCTYAWVGITGDRILDSPAVADGMVYVGSADNLLYAYAVGCGSNGETCGPVWTGTTDADIVSSPAVSGGMVYVGSTDNSLYAFAVGCGTGGANCSPVWVGPTTSGISSSPAVANGVVYVSSGNWNLYAFGVGCATGGASCSPLWRGNLGGANYHSSPAVANGIVYAAGDKKLNAFPVGCATGGATCSAAWAFDAGDTIESSPTVVDGVVYVGSDTGTFYALGLTGDWAQLRYGPSHQGYNSAEHVLGASNIYGLSVAWKADPGESIDASSPAIANGVAYIGGGDNYLYAYDIGCATGGGTCVPLWKANTGNVAAMSSPTVADGVVYMGSLEDKVMAFAVGCGSGGATCLPLWTGTTGGEVETAPVVEDGVVYVSSADNKLYAFAVGCATGGAACSPIWTGAAGGPLRTAPTVSNGVVYVGSDDKKVYAFKVGCSAGGGTCSPLWTATTGNSVAATPAVADGVVYVGSTDGNLYAYAVNCNTGGGSCSPIWSASIGATFSSPAVADGVVYVGSMDHNLYAFAVGCATGGGDCAPLWKGATGDKIYTSAPAVANGVVYVGSQDQKLYAYRVGCRSDGGFCTPLWSYTTGGAVDSSPAVSNGMVYVGCNDASLYAFALEGGIYKAATTYTAVAPARVLDTRPTTTQVTNIGLTGPFVAGTVRKFQVSGVIGVGGTGVAVPANATAVTGNLTVTSSSYVGLVALGPTVDAAGETTTSNFGAADNRANNVTLGLAPDGSLSAVFRSAKAGATTHLIFDVTGFFTPDTAGATFHAATTPGRILDSRPTMSGHADIGVKGKFASGVYHQFGVVGVKGIGWAAAQVPAGATAVTGNLTVTNATSSGYVALLPKVPTKLTTSSVNTIKGDSRANGVTVSLNGGKLVAVWIGAKGSSADVIFDVTGFFTSDLTGLRYHPVVPVRFLDSGTGKGLAGAFANRIGRTMVVAGLDQVPSDAAGISGNLTLVNPSSAGWAFISPDPVAAPTSSTVNALAHVTVANGFDLALSGGNLALFWAGTNGSTANLQLDVTGYWK